MPTPSPIVIAIDGPSASGKGTLARRLAAHFDLAYLDTGLLYRAVALGAIQSQEEPSEIAAKLDPATFAQLAQNHALRSESVSRRASEVAALPEVRAALLHFQRHFAAAPPGGKRGVVLDGRDIGTVIVPQAQVKIYVTASLEARAERRFKELQARGETVTKASVLADMQSRDRRDSGRQVAPAKPAHDAVVIDTTAKTAESVFQEVLRVLDGICVCVANS